MLLLQLGIDLIGLLEELSEAAKNVDQRSQGKTRKVLFLLIPGLERSLTRLYAAFSFK